MTNQYNINEKTVNRLLAAGKIFAFTEYPYVALAQ